MFSEQFAIMLLVAATQLTNQGAMGQGPHELARSPAAGTERSAISRKLELQPTDSATRQSARRLALKKQQPPANIIRVASK